LSLCICKFCFIFYIISFFLLFPQILFSLSFYLIHIIIAFNAQTKIQYDAMVYLCLIKDLLFFLHVWSHVMITRGTHTYIKETISPFYSSLQSGYYNRVLTHCLRARRAAMAATSTPTLHRRLGRLQSTLHRQFLVPLRQTGATVGPQVHQAPGGRNSPVVPQKVPDHEKSYPRVHGGGCDRGLLQGIQ
jgi:hypothetical protein